MTVGYLLNDFNCGFLLGRCPSVGVSLDGCDNCFLRRINQGGETLESSC